MTTEEIQIELMKVKLRWPDMVQDETDRIRYLRVLRRGLVVVFSSSLEDGFCCRSWGFQWNNSQLLERIVGGMALEPYKDLSSAIDAARRYEPHLR